MRKDAKIGFAVGGVLLAVLTVYVLVVPQHKKSAGHEAVTLAVTPSTSGDTATTSEPAVSIPPIAAASDTPAAPKPATPADKPADSKPQVAANTNTDGVNWESILGGSASAPAIKSTTPGPADPSTPAPAPSNFTGVNTPVSDITMSAVKPLAPAPAINNPVPTIGTGAHSYIVKPGQTLSTIAAAVYGNSRFYVAIKRANPNIDPNKLKPGMSITLPDISDVKPDAAREAAKAAPETAGSIASGKAYKVQSGDTLYRISKSLYGSGKQAEAIYALNKDLIGSDKSKLKIGMVLKLPSAPTATATASAATH